MDKIEHLYNKLLSYQSKNDPLDFIICIGLIILICEANQSKNSSVLRAIQLLKDAFFPHWEKLEKAFSSLREPSFVQLDQFFFDTMIGVACLPASFDKVQVLCGLLKERNFPFFKKTYEEFMCHFIKLEHSLEIFIQMIASYISEIKYIYGIFIFLQKEFFINTTANDIGLILMYANYAKEIFDIRNLFPLETDKKILHVLNSEKKKLQEIILEVVFARRTAPVSKIITDFLIPEKPSAVGIFKQLHEPNDSKWGKLMMFALFLMFLLFQVRTKLNVCLQNILPAAALIH